MSRKACSPRWRDSARGGDTVVDRLRDFIDYLQTLQFRMPDREFFETLWPTIVDIVKNPASNPAAAVVILLIGVVILLMIASGIVLLIMRTREEDEYEYVIEVPDGKGGVIRQVSTVSAAVAAKEAQEKVIKAKWVDDPLRYHKRFLWACAAAVFLLVATGITTQQKSVCMSCHASSKHAKTSAREPHGETSCVACHEGGGRLSSVTWSVVPRVVHMGQAALKSKKMAHYGATSSDSCTNCHREVLTKVTENPERQLRMSHKEPVAAGAACVECHRLDASGNVSRATQGMGPCLRCHNGSDAQSECSTCHTGDVSAAAIGERGLTGEARRLVPKADCYSCHDPAPCDSCHGVRLPHPQNYVVSHMRDAAEDLWDNEGKTCFSCHTANRRSCYAVGCHEFTMPGTHGTEWKYMHQLGTSGGCDDCHNKLKQFPNACLMCHEEQPEPR